jgi:exopolysaccharide biosynthesis polyprenyl glycosylphosphotransferase
MKKIELLFAIILVPLDYFALLLAAVLAYLIRYTDFFAFYRPTIFELPFPQYLSLVSLLALFWLIIFALAGLYRLEKRHKKLEEFKKIFLACSTGFSFILAILVFSRYLFESRFILLTSWLFSIFFVSLFRFLLRLIKKNLLYRRGIGLTKIIIIGNNPSSEAIIRNLKQNPKLGYQITASYPEFNSSVQEEIRRQSLQNNLDQILFLKPEASLEEISKVLDLANEYHLSFRYLTDPLISHAAGFEFDTLAGVPLVEIKRTSLEGWGQVYKRIFDFIGSLILIILTLPLMIIISFLVFFETGLPILFCNERVGKHGKTFNLLKFRTMYQKYCIGKQFSHSAEALKFEENLIKEKGIKEGPVYKIKDDPRVTPIGRWLRRFSLDELPQLFNVLKGDMSLVGPRPHQPREVEKYEKHHKKVLEIKPGITGLAQISGRSDLSFEEEVRLDTFYIEHWSLKLDLIILFKTPGVALSQKGAY